MLRPLAPTLLALALGLTGCTCAGPHGPDAGFEDAWGPDTFGPWPTPPEPELIWSAGVDTPCADPRTPVWTPTPRTGPRGTRRWVQNGWFSVVTDDLPTFTAGSMFFTRDRVGLKALDLTTGEVWDAVAEERQSPFEPAPRPSNEERRMLMTLGSSLILSMDGRGLVYYDVADAGRPSEVRTGRWRFPELEALTPPLPPGPRPLYPFVAAAWSPTSGTVAYGGLRVAAQCTEPDAGRFIVSFAGVEFDGRYRRMHLLYRENGELLVHYGALYVLGPRGELLRSTGLPRDSEPLAYTPECGLLYRQQATPWYLTWWDVDTLEPRQTFLIPIGSRGLRIFSRCRPVVWRNDGTWISESEVSVFPLGPDERRLLRDGGSYTWSPENEVTLFDASGAETERFTVQDYTTSSGSSTPEGDFVAPGVGYWELELDRVPSGTLSTGLNWAHTNSPLP